MSGASNTANGRSSGCSHSAGSTPCRLNTLPKSSPNAAADSPPTINSLAIGKRLRYHQPAAAMTRPWPTSPNM